MKKVCVMMSTYNGAQFLSNQIDSIFNQEDVEVSLYIRDDGSCDDTRNVLELYKQRYNNYFFVEYGSNVGWKDSFLSLIYEMVDKKYDYYCISDQDDIWDFKKIVSAINMLDSFSFVPCLYGSNLELVDVDLNRLGFLYDDGDDEFENLKKLFMLGNAPFGCTLVWNGLLQDVLLKSKPTISVAYDQWINLVANCHGKVVLDRKSYIKHIIHKNNACGVSKNQFERVKKFCSVYLSSDYVPSSSMVKEYFNIYGDSGKSEYMSMMYSLVSANHFGIFKYPEIKVLNWKKKLRMFVFCLMGIM